MTEISFEDLAKGLRGWARHQTAHEQAAVELLIWHETWLRRPDFKEAAITQLAPGLVARINWEAAREFIDQGYLTGAAIQRREHPLPASTSERAVLDVAVALGENMFRLPGLGHVHRRKVAEAFAAALGQQLEPAPLVHNHPEFIPGDLSCEACTREGADKGKPGE